MSNAFDWKKFQFITEVQTALINNAVNLSLEADAKDRRHIFSATGTLGTLDDAFYAAERIPSDMTAHEAACQFIGFACENLRERGESVPYWFQRY
jgi:hypothetical protein